MSQRNIMFPSLSFYSVCAHFSQHHPQKSSLLCEVCRAYASVLSNQYQPCHNCGRILAKLAVFSTYSRFGNFTHKFALYCSTLSKVIQFFFFCNSTIFVFYAAAGPQALFCWQKKIFFHYPPICEFMPSSYKHKLLLTEKNTSETNHESIQATDLQIT